MRKLVLLLALTSRARVRRRGAGGGDVRRPAVLEPGRLGRELVAVGLDAQRVRQADFGLRDDGDVHRQRLLCVARDDPEPDMVTYTNWWTSQVKKAIARRNGGYHWGGCYAS